MTTARISKIWRIMLLIITIFSLSSPAYAKYDGGSGEPNDPYLIYTAEQMNEIGLHQEDWGKHFKLMADIDLGGYQRTSYNIIGTGSGEGQWSESHNPFTGVFDGNNKKIYNFNHSSIGGYHIGIFGYIYDPNAVVKDLGLINAHIDARQGDHVGSLVGFLRNGTVINCYAQGGSVYSYSLVGGLVGYSDDGIITDCYTTTNVSGNEEIGGLAGGAGIITNCYATGEISGYEDVGGLVGKNQKTMTHCYSTASVTGTMFVGGLVGDNLAGSITSCYSNASVTGTYYVGGLVGDNYWGSITSSYSSASVTGTEHTGGLVGTNERGSITDCYSNASVTGNNSVGGLVAHNEHGYITDCYSTGQVDGVLNVGGLVGYMAGNVSASFWDTQTSGQATSASGKGLTTTEMNDPNTFINAGWNFIDASDGPSDIWAEPEGGGYPILCWQLPGTLGLPAFSGGIGEPNNPYLISTAHDLNSISYNPRLMDAHFMLINDIDLTGVDLFRIGTYYYPFAGMLDGNGKKISNLSGTQGLFEHIEGKNACIKDLGLIDPNIDLRGWGEVGSLVGYLGRGTIMNCYVQGGSVSGVTWIGGLVGFSNGMNSKLKNCFSSCSVFGHSGIGGLVGRNYYSSIANCFSSGSVSGTSEIGGLVGRNWYSSIVNCCSSTSVSGVDRIGGLVGINDEGTITDCYAEDSVYAGDMIAGGLVGENHAGTIKNCYSVGYVQGPNDVGGLIGSGSEDGTVIASFWDTQTSGQATSAGGSYVRGGIPLQTSQMQTSTIFLIAGWDFVDETKNGTEDIWWILEGQDYPRLWWELIPEN